MTDLTGETGRDPAVNMPASKGRPSRCPYSIRHWFTVYGAVGLRRPDCVRCGAPNPRWTPEMAAEFEAFVGVGGDDV